MVQPENIRNVDPIGSVFSSARPGRNRVLFQPENIRRWKELRVLPRQSQRVLRNKEVFAPDYNSSPAVVHLSIRVPIPVTTEKLNCAFGNTVNLLAYINHLNTGLKQKLLVLQTHAA